MRGDSTTHRATRIVHGVRSLVRRYWLDEHWIQSILRFEHLQRRVLPNRIFTCTLSSGCCVWLTPAFFLTHTIPYTYAITAMMRKTIHISPFIKGVVLLILLSVIGYVVTTPLVLESVASGLLLTQQRNAGKAVLELCLDLYSRSSACLGTMALLQYVEGNQKQAVIMISQAIKSDPDFWMSYETRGDMYHDLAYQSAELGAKDEALEYMKKAHQDYSDAISRQPNDPVLYIERAQVYLDTAYYQDALQDAQRALALQEGYGEANEMAALAYWLGFKDLEMACPHLEAAWELYNDQKNEKGRQRIQSLSQEFLVGCNWPFEVDH